MNYILKELKRLKVATLIILQKLLYLILQDNIIEIFIFI